MQKTPFGAGLGYRELECQDTSPQECRNEKSPKNFMDKRLVTTMGCEGRSLQVARLHFMIGSWKSQSYSQQIRET
jgi:hypothetical protein